MKKLLRNFFHLFFPPESGDYNEPFQSEDAVIVVLGAALLILMLILFGDYLA